ncbi:MAG: stage V sporulation protein AD [Eubacteriales bacterium]
MRVKKLNEKPSLVGCGSVAGKRESEGPLSDDFDIHDKGEHFGMNTWEKAESEMQRIALNTALAKAKLGAGAVEAVFAGDLQNQCVSSVFGLADFGVPYFGLYSACSTFAEALMLSAMLVDSGKFSACAAVTSSHFCAAERQYRFPLEYGGQRTPTAQRTVTGAGAAIVSSANGNFPRITEVMPGRIVNKGIKDANNMGAAMAPAAIDTIRDYFNETGHSPKDFDLILTGDLGVEGHAIVLEYLLRYGIDIRENYNDCGLMIYDINRQDMHAGGSGCGCSASVICGHIMKRFEKCELKNVLYIATGALMSPSTSKQGLSIPGIAHLVRIEAEGR